MITQQTILMQMDKLVAEARQASSEQHAREKFAAIKALCEVVLAEQPKLQTSVKPVMPTPFVAQSVAVSSQKLDEEDANGDSIFDF